MNSYLSKLSILFSYAMLFAGILPVSADTRVVDEKHLQEHRDFEKKNLEQQRFKTETQLGRSDLINKGKKEIFPLTYFSESRVNYFSQFQLNQSGMPLEPTGYGRFECEPSFWKTWQGFDYIFPIHSI